MALNAKCWDQRCALAIWSLSKIWVGVKNDTFNAPKELYGKCNIMHDCSFAMNINAQFLSAAGGRAPRPIYLLFTVNYLHTCAF